MKQVKASEILDRVADSMVDLFRDPASRAGFVAAMATSAVCQRMRMRMVPSVLFGLAAFYGTERLYVMINDVHEAALEFQLASKSLADAEHRAD